MTDSSSTTQVQLDQRFCVFTPRHPRSGLGQYISGCIMFEETLYQKAADGRQFVDILKAQGILPGIKVDTGLQVRVGTPAGVCLRHAC